MQVRSSLSTLPVDYRRDRSDAPAAARRGAAQPDDAPPREVVRVRARALEPDALADVPLQSRGAVTAYLSNGPTLSERYGVELAGVDLFV